MSTRNGLLRREVTRALCWLPPDPVPWQLDESYHGDWALIRERRRLIGRLGYLVITETYRMPGATLPG